MESFTDTLFFWLEDQASVEDIEILNRLLRPSGAIASDHEKIYLNNEKQHYLKISYSESDLKKNISRNAGSTRKTLTESQSLDSINSRIKEVGVESVANELGVSRATLYRRLKEAKEEGFEMLI